MLLFLICVLFPLTISKISIFFNKEPKVRSEINKNQKNVIVKNQYYSFEMDVEEFIPYVVLSQMSMDEPPELIKAQSVVIRTYILKQMKNKNKITTTDLGLSYRSYADLKREWFSDYCRENIADKKGVFYYFLNLNSYTIFNEKMGRIKNIVNKTRSKVMRKDGELILPLFHSMSNGKTRDGKKILGDEYEYLKSVRCEKDIMDKKSTNTYFFTPKQFFRRLQKNDIVVYENKKEINDKKVDDLLKMIKFKKDEQGYVLYCIIGDTEIMGDEFASSFGIASTCININKEKEGIQITTNGTGHGFGMSLCYARYLASEGKNYEEILNTFYDMGVVNE